MELRGPGLGPGGPVNDHALVDDDAGLGIAARRIELPDPNGATMDVALRLRAVGVAGSTTALASPFDRASSYYPSVDGTPFIENAYLSVRGLWGLPLVMTFGRQSFRLGSGPPGTPSAQVGTYTYTADSVVLELRRDTATRTLRMAARGHPLPYTPYLFGPWELALH